MRLANVAVDGRYNYGSKLCDWLQKSRPDIVTIQKIGSKFPTMEDLREIGYENKCLGSPRWYLGVAVLSHRDLRKKPEVRVCDLPGAEGESRFLAVNIGDLWVSSVYAPFNPEGLKRTQEVIDRRVQWLNRLRDHVYDKNYAHRDSLLCGDFNVKFRADGRRDGLYGQDDEDALKELLDLGFVDLYREAHPNPKEKPGCTYGYSETCPEGTSRLHLVLASKSLTRRLRSACVAVDSRPWPLEKAPPLIVDFDGGTR